MALDTDQMAVNGTTNEANPSQEIVISGVGLVCAAGNAAPACVAAFRAGLTRFREDERVLVPASGDRLQEEPVRVATSNLAPPEAMGDQRAKAMMMPPLRECLARASFNSVTAGRVCWYLDNRLMGSRPEAATVMSWLVEEFACEGNLAPDLPASLGQCTVFERVIQAAEDIRSGSVQTAIILVCDSLSVLPRLEQLAQSGRLLSAAQPDGFVPGEGAGALLLESAASASARGVQPMAMVSAWGQGEEPNPWYGDQPSAAEGLTEALRLAWEMRGDQGQAVDGIMIDFNGIRARGMEWSLTHSRLFPPRDQALPINHPADCIGDCGAASGAVLLAYSAVLFDYQLTTARSLVLATSADEGARRILCIDPVGRV